LHARPGRGLRPGGARHHLSPTGGPREEIAAAAELLGGAVGEVPVRQLAPFDRLREAVDGADDCADLPHALVHPDFVPANVIPTPDARAVVVDWTGAGRGCGRSVEHLDSDRELARTIADRARTAFAATPGPS
jgi:hypothetical protein